VEPGRIERIEIDEIREQTLRRVTDAGRTNDMFIRGRAPDECHPLAASVEVLAVRCQN
jgi:hypothetical protein